MVSNEHLGNSHEVNVAVDTAHVPHVLTFEVRTVGPANHAYRHVVFTRAHLLADVKFSVHIATFGIANILTIYPYISRRVNTIEVEQYAFFFPTFGKGEVAAVTTHAVIQTLTHLNVRRIVGEGVVNVDIERFAKTIHFQASGHGNLLPIRCIYVVAVELLTGHVELVAHDIPKEVPCAVKRHPA